MGTIISMTFGLFVYFIIGIIFSFCEGLDDDRKSATKAKLDEAAVKEFNEKNDGVNFLYPRR